MLTLLARPPPPPPILDSAFSEGHFTNKFSHPACRPVQSSRFTNKDTAAAKGGNSARLQLLTVLETLGLAPSTVRCPREAVTSMSQNSILVTGPCASAARGPQIILGIQIHLMMSQGKLP